MLKSLASLEQLTLMGRLWCRANPKWPLISYEVRKLDNLFFYNVEDVSCEVNHVWDFVLSMGFAKCSTNQFFYSKLSRKLYRPLSRVGAD